MFPFTRHEIREFIKASIADFELVEFAGLSSSEHYYSQSFTHQSHFVCSLKAEYREPQWYFNLEVNGLRSERYEERREEVAQALLSQIKKWVDEKLILPETAPKKPCRAHIYFDLTRKPEDIAELSEWN